MPDPTRPALDEDRYAPGWGPINPHLLIRASAGSGKTYQLSTRYLFLLRNGEQPGSILATTFTRKAAGEVLGRVITRLADAAVDTAQRRALSDALMGPPLSQDDCKALLRTLTRSLNRLAISTIDGFFNRIAQSFRHELDLPPDPRLVDEKHPAAEQLRLDAIEAMLADDDLPTLVTLLRQLHHDSSARSVTQAIDKAVTDLYETYRQAPDRRVWSRLKAAELLDEDALQQAIQTLADAAGTLPQNKHWQNAYAENLDAALARDWERFIGKGLAKKICDGDEAFQRRAITDDWRSTYQPLVDYAKAAMLQRVAMQTEATFDLLWRFDEHYTALRKRQGVLLFSDLTHKLARELPAMGDGLLEDVYFRLDGKVTHLLLDEFQDTSLTQWAVLEPFAQEVAATADGTRSLLVVGDTKQAIYGWRGGVAELFDHVETSLGLGEDNKQTLSTSYRSAGVVLNAVNDVFGNLSANRALTDEAETAACWQEGFQEHRPVRDLPGYVTLETSTAAPSPPPDANGLSDTASGEDDLEDNDDPSAASLPGAHEAYVARRVQSLYQADPGRSIGVLVSRNATASKLIFEMGRLGLPVSGEGGSRVTDSPAVAAVLSALSMADHPGDLASVFHVLNSPLAEVVELDSIEPASVRRAGLSIRRSLITRGYAQTLADWTRKVAPSCDARGVRRLTQLIELADQFDPAEALRPSRFVALAQALRVAEPSPAPIRVMTIHGAKGLEFDTVVLAELDRKLTDRSAVLIERTGATGPIVGVYRNTSKQVRAMDPRLERTAISQRAVRLMDDLCVLYVAMTRARQALHMIVTPLELTKKGNVKRKGLCYATILRDTLSRGEETLEGEQLLFEDGDPGWASTEGGPVEEEVGGPEPVSAVRHIELVKPTGTARRSWPTVRPSARAGETGGRRPASELLDLDAFDTAAMRYGTLIHAWMQQVGYLDEDPVPDDAMLLGLAERLMSSADRSWLTAQLERFHAMLNSPAAHEVLARRGATELWRERGFAVHDGRAMLRGVFDRVSVTRDERGRVTGAELVDFKTDRVEPGEAQRLADHYLPQMLAYRRALLKLLKLKPEAVKMKLWFLGPGRVVDLVSADKDA